MAFVNDYLTEEEIEKFKKLNISYGKMIYNQDNDAVGTQYYYYGEGIRCTLDRDKKMYLFYCDNDSKYLREEKWSPEFFVFIHEKTNEIIVTKVGLKRTHPNGYSGRCWELYCINSKCYKTNFDCDPMDVIEDLKDALVIFGANGDPRNKEKTNCTFKF